jgi:hypothetical protein
VTGIGPSRAPARPPDGSGWPRRRGVRGRHAPARWAPERTSEDVPSLTTTVALVVLGAGALAGLAWLSLAAAGALYAVLLVWSVGLDLTGRRVTTRIRGGLAVVLWALVRPVYAVGFAIWAVVEGVFELFG